MRLPLLAFVLAATWGLGDGGCIGGAWLAGAPAVAASVAKPTPAPPRFLDGYDPADPLVLGVGKLHIVRYADGVFQAKEDEEGRHYTFRKPGMKLAEVLRVIRAFGPWLEAQNLTRNGESLFYTQLNASGPGGFCVEAKGQGDRFDEVTYSEFWE